MEGVAGGMRSIDALFLKLSPVKVLVHGAWPIVKGHVIVYVPLPSQ